MTQTASKTPRPICEKTDPEPPPASVWMISSSEIAPATGPSTVPVPPMTAIRIIWTLSEMAKALSWLMKLFHWAKIAPAIPVSAAAMQKAATL